MPEFEPYEEWTPEKERRERECGRFFDDIEQVFRAFMAGKINELLDGPFYIFDPKKKKVLAVKNWEEFNRWFGMNVKECQIACTKIGDVFVSTVFLGLDHNFGRGGTPVLFETMIFGGSRHLQTWQTRTVEEAETDHEKAVAMVRADVAAEKGGREMLSSLGGSNE